VSRRGVSGSLLNKRVGGSRELNIRSLTSLKLDKTFIRLHGQGLHLLISNLVCGLLEGVEHLKIASHGSNCASEHLLSIGNLTKLAENFSEALSLDQENFAQIVRLESINLNTLVVEELHRILQRFLSELTRFLETFLHLL
jgi:hypothetical protein